MSYTPLDDRPITRSRSKTIDEPLPEADNKDTQVIGKKRPGPKSKRGKKRQKKSETKDTVVTSKPHQNGTKTKVKDSSKAGYSKGNKQGKSESVNTQKDSIQAQPERTLVPVTEDLVEPEIPQMSDLNSSPIKQVACLDPDVNSSPIKRLKNVMFSDDLTSEVPFLPEDTEAVKPVSLKATPRRSILKFGPDDIPSSPKPIDQPAFTSDNFHPELQSFWTKGSIVQLPPESSLLEKLVLGCISVLKDKSFNNRFEVYASFNHNFKINSTQYVQSILAPSPALSPTKSTPTKFLSGQDFVEKNYINIISALVQRDILAIEEMLQLSDKTHEDNKENQVNKQVKNDPFCTRTISQALKLISFFMTETDLNGYISVEDSRWFYTHASSMIIKPKVSKTMVMPYVGIIKECKFPVKKKRLIFNSVNGIDVPEHMLFAILNMRNFPSTSLVTEKFAAIKNFVQNFPVMMVNNFKHWFEVYLMNLCDLSSPFYSKIIGTAILSLLEISRVYLRNKDVSFMVQLCLGKKVSSSFKSFSSEEEVHLNTESKVLNTNYDIVVNTIENLIASRRYKSAVDLWVGISLLSCDKDKGFDNWSNIDNWLGVITRLAISKDPIAQQNAIIGWRAVSYNFCVSDLDNLERYVVSKDLIFSNQGYKVTDKLQEKFNFLLKLQRILEPRTISEESTNALNVNVLSMFYNILNQNTNKDIKFMDVYWDKLIEPVFKSFYFKSTTKGVLPIGIRILSKLTRKESGEFANFHSLRCLSNEFINLNEVSSINSRWIRANSEKVMNLMKIVLYRKDVKAGFKISLLGSLTELFDNTLKQYPLTARGISLKCEIHELMTKSFEDIQLDVEGISRLFRITYHCLGIFNLTSLDGVNDTSSDFLRLFMNLLATLKDDQKQAIIQKLFDQIDPQKSFTLVYYLVKYNLLDQESILIQEKLKTCKLNITSSVEVRIAGALFGVLFVHYNAFAKTVFQAMVLLNETQFEKIVQQISMTKWTFPIFKFFLTLTRPAPLKFIKQKSLEHIIIKLEREDTFIEMVEFLVLENMKTELASTETLILQKYREYNGTVQEHFSIIWNQYLDIVKVDNEPSYERLKSLAETAGVKLRNTRDKTPEIEQSCTNQNGSDPTQYKEEELRTPTKISKFPEESLSDDDSDQQNTFSLETGNDSDENEESFISTERELSSEDVAKAPVFAPLKTTTVEVPDSIENQNKLHHIQQLIGQIDYNAIAGMTNDQQTQLETQLLELMLRIKQVRS